uniref:Late expression factor-5 n=1 Tax=Caenorhabditis tropicalis TaxID=1561998 RepID=A0A1I7TNF7_9PELO
MSFNRKTDQEYIHSLKAIHRLGRCADYSKNDDTSWDTTILADSNFEVGVWEPVPVEKKRRKRHTAERKPHEPIDNDSIDYNSHLTPPIPNLKPFVERPCRNKHRFDYYENKEEYCLCYVCLIRVDLCDSLPGHMIIVTEHQKPSRLFIVENAAESLFNILKDKMVRHAVPKPLGLSHLKCNYNVVLNFFEYHCRPESVDIGIVLNDYLSARKVNSNLSTEKRLHSVFKAFVYASAAKVMYKHLAKHLTKQELHEKGSLFVKRINKLDPFQFLRMCRTSQSNIAKNFLRHY